MKVNQIAVTLGLTKYSLRASLRSRSSFFFSLIFPLLFIAIFGLFSNGTSQIKLGIASTVDQSSPIYKALQTMAGQTNAPFQLVQGSQSNLEGQLSKGDLPAVLEPGTGNTPDNITVVTSNADPEGGAQAQGIVSAVINQMNLQAAGLKNPPFKVATREVSGKPFKYIDFALPGQIGFSLVSVATFGVAFPFITLRKTLVLKRIFATAVKPISFIISQCLSRSVLALLQVAVLIAAGVKFFHFTLTHGALTFIQLLILAFLGVLAFLGFGLLIANTTRDEQTAPIALNLFNFPQFLLAGVFFPTNQLPHWLQIIGNHLPLAYLTTAMRDVANNGLAIWQTWPSLLGLLVWSILAYYVAARTFKSE